MSHASVIVACGYGAAWPCESGLPADWRFTMPSVVNVAMNSITTRCCNLTQTSATCLPHQTASCKPPSSARQSAQSNGMIDDNGALNERDESLIMTTRFCATRSWHYIRPRALARGGGGRAHGIAAKQTSSQSTAVRRIAGFSQAPATRTIRARPQVRVGDLMAASA